MQPPRASQPPHAHADRDPRNDGDSRRNVQPRITSEVIALDAHAISPCDEVGTPVVSVSRPQRSWSKIETARLFCPRERAPCSPSAGGSEAPGGCEIDSRGPGATPAMWRLSPHRHSTDLGSADPKASSERVCISTPPRELGIKKTHLRASRDAAALTGGIRGVGETVMPTPVRAAHLQALTTGQVVTRRLELRP